MNLTYVSNMENNFLNTVLELYREEKWNEIIKLNEKSDNLLAQKLLWIWPSVDNLIFIRNIVIKYGLLGITSIGCGCGLLEWIINKSTSIPVVGYEVNKEWWLSKYANPQFIKLQFTEMPPPKSILNVNCALLFCYFNDGEAFIDYISGYSGSVVIIIGPGNGCGRHTDPQPFSANFGISSMWILSEFQEIKNTKDFIAVYVRNVRKK